MRWKRADAGREIIFGILARERRIHKDKEVSEMSVDVKKKKPGQRGKGGGNLKPVVIACVVVIVALAAALVCLAMRGRNGGEAEPTEKRSVVVNEDNVEEVLSEMSLQQAVTPGYYEVTMNTTWNFADGKSASENAYVENVANNTNDVYFDVTLSDTGELIYSSPLIPLGSYLDDITLDKELEAGSYSCLCTYHLVDEEQNTLSTLNISLTIIVAE